ncbi:MAG: TetR/AcrR family transcriptional regulator [Myxococcota bacterium]
MARPRDADSAKSFDALVQAALGLIRAEGSFSMRAVAHEAGMTTGAIQYYFSSRNELIEACLTGFYDQLRNHLASIVLRAAGEEPNVVIREVLGELFDFSFNERHLLRLRSRLAEDRVKSKSGDIFADRFIFQLANAIHRQTGADEVQTRVVVFSVAAAFSRLVMLSSGEREALSGVEGDDAMATIRAHAVESAAGQLQALLPKR